MSKAKQYTDKELADRQRARMRERVRNQLAAGREIGDLPDVVNPERKKAAGESLRYFCEAYFRSTFTLEWSSDHLEVIASIERAARHGGLFAMAMPRGSGKTTLCEISCLWAAAYGIRRYVVLIGATQEKAEGNLESIKSEIECNSDFYDDFPEICFPIQKLEGQTKRAIGQTCGGVSTKIQWTSNAIVFPTVEGSVASACILESAGLTGAIRGLKFKRPDGATVRPDLVIVDDPQTDVSAKSMSQCETRERLLAGAVLGLAGPGKKIAGVMPCTVIRAGDMADRILDRKIHPEWGGRRMKMVYQLPTNTKLWDQYAEVRHASLESGRGLEDATAFYAANREAMDAGAVVSWAARFNHDELSAIQHAMNIKFQDERSFWAEFQNEPLPEDDVEELDLTVDQIAGRVNRLKRFAVPAKAQKITAMIDVQKALLYYAIVAWEDDFTGYVLDYGSWPDQKRGYFTLRDAKNTIQKATGEGGLEAQLSAALKACVANLLGRVFERDDGADMRVERCLIDANWGESTAVVYHFCRHSQFASILTPSHGKFIGAASIPFAEYKKKTGDRVGENWRVPSVKGKQATRHVLFDSNYWKTFVHTRLASSDGGRGALTIFGDKPQAHRMFAEHLTAEFRVITEGRGRKVSEWKLRPGAVDNHFFDCLVGCCVGASMQGVVLKEISAKGQATAKAKSFAELQREARERREKKNG